MSAEPKYIPLMSWDVRPKGRVVVNGTVRFGGGARTFSKDCNNTPQAIEDAKRRIEKRALVALKEYSHKMEKFL